MTEIPIFDAKNKLPSYIHQVERGEPIAVTRHNKRVAIIVSKDMFESISNDISFETSYKKFRNKYQDLYEIENFTLDSSTTFGSPKKTRSEEVW